jgi:hypothetical protein
MVHCGCVNPLHNTGRPVACLRSMLLRLAGWIVLVTGLLDVPLTGRAQVAGSLVDFAQATWRYNDSGANLGTAWRANNYSVENTWPVGQGLFGVEGSSPYPYPHPIRTALMLVPGRTTYYFRTKFNYSGQTDGLNLRATAYLDDGAVVYLNGVEVSRVRLPAGTITSSTKAQLASPEGVASLIAIPGSRLVQGENVLAVELHQSSDTSSDVVFGLALDVLTVRAPAFLDPAEPRDRSVAQEASTTLLAAASGSPAPRFQWFQNGALLPSETNEALVISSMSALNAGNYFCVASSSEGSVTSRTAVVTYLPDTNGPSLLYAFGQASLTEVLVVFSEPPEPSAAVDNFGWEILSADGATSLTVLFGTMMDDTTLILSTTEQRDPNTVYVVRRLYDLPELVNRGNPLVAGSEVTVASFPAPLVLMDDVQLWRYNDSGLDPGAVWKNSDYDDSAWTIGLAPFDAFRQPDGSSCRGFIPAVDDPVRTCLTLSNATGTAQIPAAYFRTRFHFEGDAAHTVLRLTNVFNDGAVFYLNGVEFLRVGMPDGEIAYDSLATQTLGDAITEVFDLYVPSLVVGENVLAVEVHQGTLKSDNLTFGVDLFAILPARPTIRSRMAIRINGSNAEVIWSPAGGSLEYSDDPATGWAPVQEIYGSDRLITPVNELRRFYRVVMPQ